MKTNLLSCVAAFGLLAVGNAVAQSLSLVPPIIVQVSELDTYQVWAFPRTRKAMDGAVLMIPLKGFDESEVEALVQNGELLDRPVWIMDGATIITEQRPFGMFWRDEVSGRQERRLALQFTSLAGAQSVATRLYFQPGLEALIQHHKAALDDQRFWICPMFWCGGCVFK